MGSGGSKDRDKKGEGGKQQQQAGDQAAQGQAENPVYNEGTSEQQQKQQEAPTDQQTARAAAAESEATMAEEYVEAVVAKASDFGDNEWVVTIFYMTLGGRKRMYEYSHICIRIAIQHVLYM